MNDNTTMPPGQQYVLAKTVQRKNGRIDKIPLEPFTFQPADAQLPANWLDWLTASQLAAALGLGVGFVLTEQGRYFCVDVDHCIDNQGELDQRAVDLLRRFPGAYVEVSQSGDGLHIIGRHGGVPAHKTRFGGIEVYTRDRFIFLTCNPRPGMPLGDANTDHTEALTQLLSEAPASTPTTLGEWTSTPCEGWSGPEDDDELLERACKSGKAREAFGGKVSFAQVFGGDPAALAAYDHDASRADMALAMLLAWWTGKNCERMERLMHQSGLVRDKWRDRPDYLRDTILKACALTTQVHGEKALAVVQPSIGAAPAPREYPSLADPFSDYCAPGFPLGVLPLDFQTFCLEKAAQSGFDPGAYGFGLMVASANTVDHRARCDLGPFKVPPFMWGGLVGASGDGKSPIINDSTRAAEEINKRSVQNSQHELAQWLSDCEVAKTEKTAAPKKPPWKQRHALDTTTEALAQQLRDNPEGVNLYPHEITEWVGRMDAYSGKDGGKDRGVYLRAYDGGQTTINRVSKPPLVVSQFSVGILAGMQPEKLAFLFKKSGGGSDGLYQRFGLYCLRPAGEVNYSAQVSPYTECNVNRIFQLITEFKDLGGRAITLAPDAKKLMQDYHNLIRKVSQRTAAARFAEHLDKFPGMLGRMALALHIVHAAAANHMPDPVLGAETMRKALEVMRVLYRHSEAVYRTLDTDAGDVHKMVVSAAEAILAKGWTEFKRGDLTRNATHWQGADARQAEGAIDYLIELGWIADVTPATVPGKRGRRSDGAFLVNPDVHTSFSEKAQRIREARAERYRAVSSVATGN